MTAAHRRAGAAERGGRVGVGVGVGVGTSRNKDSEKELVSERESWWRSTIKDSPDPGSYHVRDFLEEAQLNPVKMTYNFRGKGRERPAGWLPSGGLLLPGAYNHRDFLQRTEKRPASYSFKNSPRPDCYTLGIRDKDIDVSPCAYNIVDDPVPKLPCKHAMFRSAVQRETFLPKEGPAPGQYNVSKDTSQCAVTSCFRSAVPRMVGPRSKTPGPGTYELSRQTGQRLETEATMGRAHGLFFRNVFDF
ncbi:protein STPG4 isoform X2 [Amia ocellicauda]|uniref:protein STPG4 isoform X2 n=1 Tax=Amia ocellicauda TaxID=2972642 RepID=UPI00346437AF